MPKKKSSSKTKTTSPKNDTGVMMVISYFVLFVVNALILHFANMYFPNQVVLGTLSIDRTWAIIHSMGTLALIGTLAMPFFHIWEEMKGKMLSNAEWMIGYFVVNFAGLWLVARLSEQFGFGVTSWMVVAVLAFVMDFFQGLAMMAVAQLTKKA